jgi:hypothetical protein
MVIETDDFSFRFDLAVVDTEKGNNPLNMLFPVTLVPLTPALVDSPRGSLTARASVGVPKVFISEQFQGKIQAPWKGMMSNFIDNRADIRMGPQFTPLDIFHIQRDTNVSVIDMIGHCHENLFETYDGLISPELLEKNFTPPLDLAVQWMACFSGMLSHASLRSGAASSVFFSGELAEDLVPVVLEALTDPASSFLSPGKRVFEARKELRKQMPESAQCLFMTASARNMVIALGKATAERPGSISQKMHRWFMNIIESLSQE